MRKRSLAKYLRFGSGLLLSGVTLYLALRGVSIWEVSRTIRQADLGLIVLGLLSVLANTCLKGVRWYRLAGEPGKQAGSLRIFAVMLAGQLLNFIYPARAGDVGRVMLVGKDGNEKAYILGSLVLEKAADLVAYLLLAVIIFLQLPFPVWLNRAIYIAAGLVLALLAGVLWLARGAERGERFGKWLVAHRLPGIPQQVWEHFTQWVFMSLSAIGQVNQRRQAAELAVWTLLVWLTAWMTNVLVIYAVGNGLEQSGNVLQMAWLVLIGLMAGIAVPSIPGRIGVFEYICILTLATFGIEQTQALTYGILLHVVVFLPVLVLGVAALLWISWKPPARQPQADQGS